jgi:hypothetical protein
MKLFLFGMFVVLMVACCPAKKACCAKVEKTCHKVEKDSSCHKK